jgi:hypothetical protein
MGDLRRDGTIAALNSDRDKLRALIRSVQSNEKNLQARETLIRAYGIYGEVVDSALNTTQVSFRNYSDNIGKQKSDFRRVMNELSVLIGPDPGQDNGGRKGAVRE